MEKTSLKCLDVLKIIYYSFLNTYKVLRITFILPIITVVPKEVFRL